MAEKMLSFQQFGSILISVSVHCFDFPFSCPAAVTVYLEVFPKARKKNGQFYREPKNLMKIVEMRITLQLEWCLFVFRGLGSMFSNLLL